MIYVIGDQQDAHSAQFFKILELMGAPFANKVEHVGFGMAGFLFSPSGVMVF